MDKAYIEVIGPKLAEGALKRAYRRIGGSRGSIANVHQAQSLHPKAMMAHLDLYMAIMYDESPLNRLQRELIGVVVSYFNKCDYCIIHHYEALKFNWKDAPPVEDLEQGIGLDANDRNMILFVKKLTLYPDQITKTDTHELRTNDFSDRAILDMTLIIGYFNFVNRLVIGVGVQLEDQEQRYYKY